MQTYFNCGHIYQKAPSTVRSVVLELVRVWPSTVLGDQPWAKPRYCIFFSWHIIATISTDSITAVYPNTTILHINHAATLELSILVLINNNKLFYILFWKPLPVTHNTSLMILSISYCCHISPFIFNWKQTTIRRLWCLESFIWIQYHSVNVPIKLPNALIYHSYNIRS